MAIRLAVVKHHYRDGWEWHDDLMPEGTERLNTWRSGAESGGDGADVLDQVRDLLDEDLDTPGAIEAIDEAATDGVDVTEAAMLLGVDLSPSA